MKAAIAISLFVLIVVGYAAVSTSDYYESLQRQEHQCAMIESGAWPNAVNPNC